MSVNCILCKEDFDVPATEGSLKILLECPACGFAGVWADGCFTVPTHDEETSLTKYSGVATTATSAVDASDRTVIAEPDKSLPLPYKRQLFLRFESGERRGETISFESGRLLIGRQGADLPLNDAKVSRKHSIIEAISRDNIFVRDLASTNGTLLNGAAIQSKKLVSGDRLQIGDTLLAFYWEDVE